MIDKGTATSQIEAFIRNKFLRAARGRALSGNDSFMEKGIIDSAGVLELVAFIEETFPVHFNDEDLTPENLDSLNSIVAFIEKKTSA